MIDKLLALINFMDDTIKFLLMFLFWKQSRSEADSPKIKSNTQMRKKVKKTGYHKCIIEYALRRVCPKKSENNSDKKTLYGEKVDEIGTAHCTPSAF
jgi:hypothetical protein